MKKMRKKTQSISYDETVDYLFRILPEISNFYEGEKLRLKWNSNAKSPHLVFGSIFSDFLRQILLENMSEKSHSRSDIIRRSFLLIEDFVQSADFETRCIVETSILESLLGQEKDDWSRFSPYFGKQTFEMTSNLAEKWSL